MYSAERSYVPLRQVDWRLVVGLVALNTVLLFAYRQLDYLANFESRSPLLTFAEEAAGGIAGFSVFPLIYWVAIRFPFPSPKWRRNLLVHLIAVCGISVVHTSVIIVVRSALFPLLGFHQSYGYLPVRYPMEFAHLFIYYWFGISLVYFYHEVRFARERELRNARMEANLAEARLQNLRLQLEPHFLFNALNAISTAIYESPRAADEMIGRLGDLLRQLMKDKPSQLVPLQDEIEILQLYIRMMEARFEERLSVSIDIPPSVRQALVPQLILQPLVENAIRHGADSSFRISLELQARAEGEWLQLTVRDHGCGIHTASRAEFGIGLKNTSERLKHLYGAQQSFELRNAPGGGAIAEVRIALRFGEAAPAVSPEVSTRVPA